LTLTAIGRCLVTLGRADEAVEPLREAHDVLAALRAAPAIAEVDRLLADPMELPGDVGA
jgi:hypothetical protein